MYTVSTRTDSKSLNEYISKYRNLGLMPVPLWKGQKTPRIEELKPYLVELPRYSGQVCFRRQLLLLF